MSHNVYNDNSKSDCTFHSLFVNNFSMNEETTFMRALEFWLAEKKITQGELASKIGVNPNTISQYKKGERNPTVDKIEALAKALGLSLVEFLSCHDASRFPDIEFVPKLKARPRAGTGGLETDGDAEEYYSFHSKFLHRKCGDKDSMRIFAVDGDSMEPTLHNKDLVMINQSQTDIRSGQIYLLRFENELMIKRLERRAMGEIYISSDNPRYEPITIKPTDEGVDFQVFGRMVWLCREF